jgi:hypothetical protein
LRLQPRSVYDFFFTPRADAISLWYRVPRYGTRGNELLFSLATQERPMQIKGLEGMDGHELATELDRGARFVIFEYCISILVMTFKQPSSIYFIRGGESAFGKGLKYSLLSLLLGWWGIPWGPIYTIWALVVNMKGGTDVTQEVIAGLSGQVAE